MPKIDNGDEDESEQTGYGVWTILKIPSVALAAVSIASTSMSLGFVSATLEPHIRVVRSQYDFGIKFVLETDSKNPIIHSLFLSLI